MLFYDVVVSCRFRRSSLSPIFSMELATSDRSRIAGLEVQLGANAWAPLADGSPAWGENG